MCSKMNLFVMGMLSLLMAASCSITSRTYGTYGFGYDGQRPKEPPLYAQVIDVRSCQVDGKCKGEHGDIPKENYFKEDTLQDKEYVDGTKVNIPNAKYAIEEATKILLTVDLQQSPIKVGLKSRKMGANLYLTNQYNTTEIFLQLCYYAGGDKKEYVLKEQHGLMYRECSNRLTKTDQELMNLNMYYKEKDDTGYIDHIWMAIEWDEQNIWVGPLHLLPLSSRTETDLDEMGILHCKLRKPRKLKRLALGAPPEGAEAVDAITVSTLVPQPPLGSQEAQYKFIPWE